MGKLLGAVVSANSLEQSAKLQTPRLAAATITLFTVVFYAMIFPFYAGHATTLFMFVASGTLLLGCAAVLHPSFFVVVLASFLTLGFLLKAVAHLTFGAQLIEPVGDFSESPAQWDMALRFVAAGQFGGVASIILASFIPSHCRSARSDARIQRRLGNILFGALALLLVVATSIYVFNYRYAILRIGYPLGFPIDPRAYAPLAFILTWGALLGGLALTQWLIELERLRYASLILVASFLGFLSSLTMGSRIQFLLYILASICIVLWRRKNVERWAEIVVALCTASLLFVLSIAVVSIERNYAFQGGQQSSSVGRETLQSSSAGRATPTLATKFEVVTGTGRLIDVLHELRSLVLMRWIGLEGVLTTEGAERELGADLLLRGLTEDPAAGKNGIYQKMSGNFYAEVEDFTFLTLPGIIGFASYSGNIPLIFGFVFGTILAGHLVEFFVLKITGNVAVGAISGISLAYLTVQMGFPWTLFIYAIELCLACAALAGFWFASRWLVTSSARAARVLWS